MPEQIQELLGLGTQPVAMSFRDEPPEHIPLVEKAEAAGCGYWRRAAEGESFHTGAADHFHCPIGCHTHNVEVPAERAGELSDMLGLMEELGYIAMEEVPGISRRQEPFRHAVYSPLKDAAEVPDVVIVAGEPSRMMLLSEAAVAAGIGVENGVMGRPTCAMIPAAVQTGRSVSSLGCIGNRVYTGLPDEKFYFALPGMHIGALVEKLEVIVSANQALEQHHRLRQAEI